MGKSLESARTLIHVLSSSAKPHRGAPSRIATARATPNPPPSARVKLDVLDSNNKIEARTPLATVVADCTKRWFQDTLKEAKAGDSAMQLLVAQMYYSGYGVQINHHKGHFWSSKASRNRSSVWKLCRKRPGYRASDSDSSEHEDKDKFS